MKILHQAGHNAKWNIDSLHEREAGDGIIFSPVHQSKSKLLSVDRDRLGSCYFDPQFFIPGSDKTNLHSYDFFPQKVSGGFLTTNYEAVASDVAAKCVDFQANQNFDGIIIPARYFPDMETDYVLKQQSFSIDPFLVAIRQSRINRPIFISLPVTSAMLADHKYRANILNWVTGYPEVYGIYLLNNFAQSTKQISDADKLIDHIEFIISLQQADLRVIVGYCNAEALLLSCLNPFAVTIGAYENTRTFTIDKFLSHENDRRGPTPRLYVPKLLNWIRWNTIMEIRKDHPSLWRDLYEPTVHSEKLFNNNRNLHFTNPQIYRHYFTAMTRQIQSMQNIAIPDRPRVILEVIQRAHEWYKRISKAGVMFFDDNCGGIHIPAWNRAIRKLIS